RRRAGAGSAPGRWAPAPAGGSAGPGTAVARRTGCGPRSTGPATRAAGCSPAPRPPSSAPGRNRPAGAASGPGCARRCTPPAPGWSSPGRPPPGRRHRTAARLLSAISTTSTASEEETTVTGYFEPVSVGALKLPNRLLMAPMTRSRARGGLVGPATAEYYAQRAAAGLIITEGTQPSVRGQGYIDTPGLHTADQVAAWHEVTGAVHAAGGRIFAQIMHS